MYKEYRICTRNIGYVQGIYDIYKEHRICTRNIGYVQELSNHYMYIGTR